MIEFKTQEAYSVVKTLQALYGLALRFALYGYLVGPELAGLPVAAQQELKEIYENGKV